MQKILILTLFGVLLTADPCAAFPVTNDRHPGRFDRDGVIDEVTLVIGKDRLLVFSAVADEWFKKDLRIREKVAADAVGGRVVVVVTNQRVLGFSAIVNRWTEVDLRSGEKVERVEARGNVGSVVTNIRAMGFNARTGEWIETSFPIDQGP